jgi:hypothetical protein
VRGRSSGLLPGLLAAGGEDGSVAGARWRVRGQTAHGHAAWVDRVVFSRDGEYLACGGEDRTVRLSMLDPMPGPYFTARFKTAQPMGTTSLGVKMKVRLMSLLSNRWGRANSPVIG